MRLPKLLEAITERPSDRSPRKLASEAMWAGAGQLGAAAGLIVGIRVLTELLAPATYGAVMLFVGVATLAGSAFSTPIGQAALRLYPDALIKNSVAPLTAALWWYFRITTLALVALIWMGGAIYGWLHHSAFSEFLALSAVVVVDVARIFDSCYLNAMRRQRAYAIWLIAEAWARPLFAVAAVLFFGESVTHVLAGYAVASALVFTVMHRTARPAALRPPTTSALTDHRRALWHYALPLVPLAWVVWISSLSDRYVIGIVCGLAPAGLYAAAYGLASRPFVVISMSLITMLRPIYYEAVSQRRFADAMRTLRVWLAGCVLLGSIVTVLIYVARRLIVRVALNTEYREAAELMTPIALGYTFWAMGQAYATACLAFNRPMRSTMIEVCGASLALGMGVPMIVWKGVAGAAWAVPLYYATQLLIAQRLAKDVMLTVDDVGDTVPG